jgi:hypothetical protein
LTTVLEERVQSLLDDSRTPEGGKEMASMG